MCSEKLMKLQNMDWDYTKNYTTTKYKNQAYQHHKVQTVSGLCVWNLASFFAPISRLSWKLHVFYHQTQVCSQILRYTDMDLQQTFNSCFK